MERTLFEFWSFLGGSGGSVLDDEPIGSGCLKFGILRFVSIPNGKFTHFLIFYAVRTFGSIQGSVFSGMLEGSKIGFRGRT